MSKISYNPDSPLAKDYAKTEFIGTDFIQETLLGEVLISSVTGTIWLRIRWKYTWLKDGDVKDDWTPEEKSLFITNAYMAVCYERNGRVFYSVSGTSDFAKKFQGKKLPFYIEILPVESNAHWNVTVTKLNPGVDGYTFVRWADKFIQLDSNDVVAVERCLGKLQDICRSRSSVPHEIGHLLLLDDEYYNDDESDKVDKIYGEDADGLMNIGAELRPRYLEHVSVQLNAIIPDTHFSLMSVNG